MASTKMITAIAPNIARVSTAGPISSSSRSSKWNPTRVLSLKERNNEARTEVRRVAVDIATDDLAAPLRTVRLHA